MGESFNPKAFVKTLTHRPGVYRMIGGEGEVLYVGKAKDLKRRVSSYFTRAVNGRIQLMVSQVQGIEVTVTNTEAEALLLENNLIKSLKPRYNVLLRDDKSYPYIYLSDHEYPRLSFHRGSKHKGGRLFGPYPSSHAVRETLQLLQKLFPVRQCEDSVFNNRSRPCLQYQIKRCTAPCVSYVSAESYDRDVRDTELFLEGKSSRVVERLMQRMEEASEKLEFEVAAHFRDQIAALRQVQERQYVMGEKGDLDIVAAEVADNLACVQLFFVRAGRNLGNKVFYMKTITRTPAAEVISAFISQYYPGKHVPVEIIVSEPLEDQVLLEQALMEEAGGKVNIRSGARGERRRWLAMAQKNAHIALESRLADVDGVRHRLKELQDALGFDEIPTRMECFDISHTSGQQTVASCVVFGEQGPMNDAYRRFNIKGITPGDDYAAMRQALERRYSRVQQEGGELPDILFIDGGKGQLSAAAEIMDELSLPAVTLVGIAKGPDRKAGMEQLFLLGRDQPLILHEQSAALHLVQHIRDESHRFAITGHRRQRDKHKKQSTLESIPGIGPKRRQRLLRHFGGLQGLQRAGVEDILKVEGISRKLAQEYIKEEPAGHSAHRHFGGPVSVLRQWRQ